MTDKLSDQELTALFHKHLPHKPLPPELAARLKQQVLAAVATTLPPAPRPELPTLPPEASPIRPFVAEHPDDQALHDLFQQSLAHPPLSSEAMVSLQEQVLAVVDMVRPAAPTVATPKPIQRKPSQQTAASRRTPWAVWVDWLRQIVLHPPSLALGGVASVLIVMLVLVGLRLTLNRTNTPSATPVAEVATVTAPGVIQHQAQVIITEGQALIQKANGQTEAIAAGPMPHWLAPGDRLITQESTARISYFTGASTIVEPGAEVELQEYAEDGASTRVALLVHSGKTSHEINTPLAETDLFEIRTPAVVASAKYTKLTVEVLSETQTHIETEAGSAQVLTEQEEVIIAAGQQMTVTTENPWSLAPLDLPGVAATATPLTMPTRPASPTPTSTASVTALPTVYPNEPDLLVSTVIPDKPTFSILPSPIFATRESIISVPTAPEVRPLIIVAPPTNTPVLPTITATRIVPTYAAILVPTDTPTSYPDTPTLLPTNTLLITKTAESSTNTPIPATLAPVNTSTATNTSVPLTLAVTPLPSSTPTPPNILVPTDTPTSVLVPTVTNTPVPPTRTPTQPATPTKLPTASPTATTPPTRFPTATNTSAPTATATNLPVPSSTATNSPVPTVAATNTPVPVPTATNSPVPTSTATDTPVPLPTATDTPVPTATDTPVPLPTATDTPQPTATETAVPLPTATDTPAPTATETPVPSPTATDTPEPTATETETAVPSPTETDTLEPLSVATDTPVP